MATRIIIFAKAPVPGKVKTRLIPALGEEGAAQLARTMFRQAIGEAQLASVGQPEICVDPHPNDPAWADLLPAGFRLSCQGEGDLGERLARAAKRALADGNAAILIGTDCPALNHRCLREIASELRSCDALLCPATDGGYVALGLRRYDPAIFQGISWGSSSVARETISRIEALGWALHMGSNFHDIDVPADLEHARLAK